MGHWCMVVSRTGQWSAYVHSSLVLTYCDYCATGLMSLVGCMYLLQLCFYVYLIMIPRTTVLVHVICFWENTCLSTDQPHHLLWFHFSWAAENKPRFMIHWLQHGAQCIPFSVYIMCSFLLMLLCYAVFGHYVHDTGRGTLAVTVMSSY